MTLGVVAITPGDGRDLLPWLVAIGPHVHAVILREPGAALTDVADWVAAIRAANARAIVHQKTDPAGLIDADARHLADGAPAPRGTFGQSAHSAAGVDQAFAHGATYVLLSPVWAPRSKHDARVPLGLARFVAIAGGRPVLALGGLTPARAARVHAAGYGVAALGAVFGAATPTAAAARVAALR